MGTGQEKHRAALQLRPAKLYFKRSMIVCAWYNLLGDVGRMAPPLKQKQVTTPSVAGARRVLRMLLIVIAAAFAAMAVTVPGPAGAQNIQRIAAIVNDEVISRYDVEQRVRLVISTSKLDDTAETRRHLRQQVLRGLIDESLQSQAAQQHSVQVSQSDLDRAYSFIEKKNKVPPGGLGQFMQANQIPKAALETQIRAEISWSKLVRRRLARSVQIGDEEIDEVLARLRANAGRSERQISEIFLPVDTPEQEEDVRRASISLLRQLRGGATFAAMARQFSRGATSAQGGAVGWVQPGQLAAALDIAIAKLDVGAVSEPVRAGGGYYLLRLHQRRKIAAEAGSSMQLQLKQILLPLPEDAGEDAVKIQEKLAQTVSENATGCSGVNAVAKELKVDGATDLGTLALANLPQHIANAIKDLAIGRFSAPIQNKGTVMLLMVCKREEIKGRGPSRESISDNLTRERLAMLAQRYLRDLRRSAVVELR